MTDVPEEEQVKTCGLAVNAALKGMDGIWAIIELSERLSVIRCHRQHDPFCHTDANLARRSMRRLEHCTAPRSLGMPAAAQAAPGRIQPWEGLRWPRRCQRIDTNE